jgi:hypothetical protein
VLGRSCAQVDISDFIVAAAISEYCLHAGVSTMATATVPMRHNVRSPTQACSKLFCDPTVTDALPPPTANKPSPQPTSALIWSIGALFVPAVIGLGWQVFRSQALSDRLLAFGLLLTGIEQGRMAMVDLRQVAAVGRKVDDRRLIRFYRVLLLVIAGQIVGFYLAAAGRLGYGAGVIMVSIIGFNLAAGLQLQPTESPPLRSITLRERLGVLLADLVALALVALWLGDIGRVWIGVGLLTIALTYVTVKLLQIVWPTA